MTEIPTSRILRWGLIGPGNIAGQFAAALEVVENSVLHAVAGRNRASAERFSSEYGAHACYEKHHELLDNPDIDAVYIATPHRYHFALARDCLLAGKAVLCEKPLTVNALDAQELIELSRQTGVFLMEALWTRFLPIYNEVSQWLVAGKIGKVESVTSSFGFVGPRSPTDRLLNGNLAGGVLLDLGVYNLSMSQWIFGVQPRSHSTDAFIGNTGVDEHGKTTMTYSNGQSSQFVISMNKQLDNDLTIYGSDGYIHIHPMFWRATGATLVTGAKRCGMRQSVSIKREFRATGLEYEIEAAAQCIRKGLIECPVMSHRETLATMQLMDAIRCDMGLSYAFE